MLRYQSHLVYRLFFFIICIIQICNAFAQSVSNCSGNEISNKEQWISWSDNQDEYSIDKQFWITTVQVSHLPNDTVWIDVRSKSAQLNNPLNILTIPLNQLESKDFLFDQTVVLVGTGFDQFVISKTINQLRAKGFKDVFALSGGVRSWFELKQPDVTLSDEISSEEFLLGGKTIDWQVITVGLTTKEIKALPAKSVRSFNLSKDSTSELNQFLSNEPTKNNAFIRYVLITPNEQSTLFLKYQLTLPKSSNVVWLKGGLANYQHYTQQQTNLINNAGLSLSKPCRLTL